MARPISDKYRRRVAAQGRETLLVRLKARGILKKALVETTDEQLYDVTSLPTSGAMRRAIKTRLVPGGVEVFYDPSVAPHAAGRVNKKGRSKTGGHQLDMQPSRGVRARADPQIRALSRRAQRSIVEGR